MKKSRLREELQTGFYMAVFWRMIENPPADGHLRGPVRADQLSAYQPTPS